MSYVMFISSAAAAKKNGTGAALSATSVTSKYYHMCNLGVFDLI